MKYIARDGKWELLPDDEYIPPQDKYEYERLPEKPSPYKHGVPAFTTLPPIFYDNIEELKHGLWESIRSRFIGDDTPDSFDPLFVANRIVGNE